MGRLDGKVVLITGGARGQGRSHAIAMAREGAEIVVTDICEAVPGVIYEAATEEDLAQTVEAVEAFDRRCLAIKADVRSSEQMDEAVARAVGELGRVDVVVANAGIVMAKTWDEIDDFVWDTTVGINLTGVWHSVRPAIPHMIEQGGGSIILTSSSAALHGQLGLLPYTAAKAGIIGMVKSLSVELGPHSIRVNAISPGTTATTMVHSQVHMDIWCGHEGGTREEMEFPARAQMLLPVPWLEPEDQSNAVVFLASEEARYITGIDLPIDAGTTNQPPGIPPTAAERLGELESKLAAAQ